MSAHTPTSEVLGSGLVALQEDDLRPYWPTDEMVKAGIGSLRDESGWEVWDDPERSMSRFVLESDIRVMYEAMRKQAPDAAIIKDLLAALIAAEVRMVFANKHIDCDRELEQMRAAIQKATVSHS